MTTRRPAVFFIRRGSPDVPAMLDSLHVSKSVWTPFGDANVLGADHTGNETPPIGHLPPRSCGCDTVRSLPSYRAPCHLRRQMLRWLDFGRA